MGRNSKKMKYEVFEFNMPDTSASREDMEKFENLMFQKKVYAEVGIEPSNDDDDWEEIVGNCPDGENALNNVCFRLYVEDGPASENFYSYNHIKLDKGERDRLEKTTPEARRWWGILKLQLERWNSVTSRFKELQHTDVGQRYHYY